MRSFYIVILAFFLSAGMLRAESVSKEEIQKQNEFKVAYSTQERLDRAKALKLLDGLTHPSTWELLAVVAQGDQDKEVRVAAFKMLSLMPARDPNLGHILALIFQGLKPSEVETLLEMMPHMKNSEYKYEIIDAMVEYGSKMRYPDLVSGNGYRPQGMSGGKAGDPNELNKKLRASFENFLKIFNSIASSDVKEPDKGAPLLLRKWWEPRRNKILLADRAITEKYRAEDRAKADKNNPLVPKTAVKTAPSS